jgi:hypothetical protein
MDASHSWSDIVDNIVETVTGLGLITLVLFPFAVPMLGLTIVAVLVLALPLAVVAAILTGTWLGMRAAGRRIRRLGRPRGRAGAARTALTGTAARRLRPRRLG